MTGNGDRSWSLGRSHGPDAGRGACGWGARWIFGSDGSHGGRRCRGDNDGASWLRRWPGRICGQPWWPAACGAPCLPVDLRAVCFVRAISVSRRTGKNKLEKQQKFESENVETSNEAVTTDKVDVYIGEQRNSRQIQAYILIRQKVECKQSDWLKSLNWPRASTVQLTKEAGNPEFWSHPWEKRCLFPNTMILLVFVSTWMCKKKFPTIYLHGILHFRQDKTVNDPGKRGRTTFNAHCDVTLWAGLGTPGLKILHFLAHIKSSCCRMVVFILKFLQFCFQSFFDFFFKFFKSTLPASSWLAVEREERVSEKGGCMFQVPFKLCWFFHAVLRCACSIGWLIWCQCWYFSWIEFSHFLHIWPFFL